MCTTLSQRKKEKKKDEKKQKSKDAKHTMNKNHTFEIKY